MSKPREPKAGEKLSAEEAKAYVDYLYSTLYKAWHEKIHNGPFMTQLREGKLPIAGDPAVLQELGTFLNGGECAQRGLLLHPSAILRS